MKKILAIAIVVVMTAALCLTASAIHNPEDTTAVWMNTDEFKMSWDTIYINGASHMDLGWGADGAAPGKLAEHQPLSTADVETFTIRGWAGLINGTVATWGYKINDGNPVFDEGFTKPTEDAVIGAGGDSRFEIVVPVNKSADPILITAVAKGEDGNVYDFIEFSLGGQYVAKSDEQPSQPAAEPRYVWNHTGEVNGADPFNDTTRVGHDSAQTATIRFKTDVKFSKILFPMIWATPHANVTVELLSNGTSVYSGTTELFNESAGSGDVANVEFDIGKKLPAGEYTMVLSAPEGFYAFFAYGADPLSADYIEFERGHVMFGLYTEDSGNGFVTFATEVNNNDDEQQTNPGTSDAAVIAIAAVACIALAGAVIAKKVR